MTKEQILKDIAENLVEMEPERVVELCNEALNLGILPEEIIDNGLIAGMDEVGNLYEEEEYFVPEVLICADALYAGLDVVKPHITTEDATKPIKVVIGVVQGDTHDIGKNLVKIMMGASGIDVHDLGRDVPLEQFIEKAEEIEADFIGMSTLMTTTMDGMEKVIKMLEEKGLRNKYKVFIGGGPISQSFADKIGADIYTNTANEAVRRVKEVYGGL
ncbi:corrinoid protein [Methanococcus maripaludis]|uniref:Coenzyme B12-binding:Cobalamin-dependent methionine synthase, B12-binding n=2 Tax=Methanococcus maripaludis TaxID=39152 RepID=Q6LY42_METMP|nr:corrinoid protein [Methanococcus maripaludis]MBM7409187.1 dimethylamine corrinoid protein [Methanococcus maripaludis]MBP2218627.1 dimethylamine corrinoid protein [Methanococcus maripaludis]CAF30707.1 Coenzyme B12-binding:Cobalamin-dependent methionine synthase, B12-binding [Methanococcus maripaludis S2]